MNIKPNMRMGDILVELGYVTQEQMREAVAYQKEHRNRRIGQILIDLKFVDEGQVLEALSNRLDIPIADIKSLHIDLDAVARVSRDFAEKNLFLPVSVKDGTMTVVTNDPLNYFAQEELRQSTGLYIDMMLGTEADLRRAIGHCFSEVGAESVVGASRADDEEAELGIDVVSLGAMDDDEAPAIKLINTLLERAIRRGASDIHIEPFETGMSVRMRIDGVVLDYAQIQKASHASLIARIKIMSNLDIAEKRLPQDGHFRVKIDEQFVNIRVSMLPTVFGEKAVLRVLAPGGDFDHEGQFGMDDVSYNAFRHMLDMPNGIIYFTGPTGSGKSTTLYMILEHLAKRQVNITTIEDPVEKNIGRVTQTQVNIMAGMTFDKGLRALLRQDPDIIMVGETRDSETAKTAVRAAITGHLVLSTLHTNDASSAVMRLIDMGVEDYLVAGSLVGVVAQRLMRKICRTCAKEAPATDVERRVLGIGPEAKMLKKGEGCAACGYTGYKGRIAIHEVMRIDSEIRRMVVAGCIPQDLDRYARERLGMKTLKESAAELVLAGVTTVEELLRIVAE